MPAHTRPAHRRRLPAILLAFCLLAAPASVFGSKGDKHYKRGLQHEAAQQWEKAAEEFSLAVAAAPSNAEFQLHYRRALFNASQAFMQQGTALAERGDHVGAYNAFRRAYSYDQSNELARSMMERSLRLQTEKDGPPSGVPTEGTTGALSVATPARVTPTSYNTAREERAVAQPSSGASVPRAEQLRVITYSGDLEKFIKYLARELRLNVIFDRDFPRREVSIDLQDVTPAQTLDYVFLTQGLFFQKLSSRTILVADQTKRPQYQQLVLRTFYLSNIDPNDARALIQASIPPQAGRQPVITPNKATNSITVRDTPENVRLVGEILKNIDKDRAEVVMDVQIYEVSRTDLMQFGNQIGDSATLTNLGGVGTSSFGGRALTLPGATAALPTVLSAAVLLPGSGMSALQRRDNTRLIASTQVHAFDNEKSTAHIGQRVPVQTAAVTSFGVGAPAQDGANPQAGVAQTLFGGNGYPVIQYEKTGLTLEFTPQVAPNLDVQVKMSIKSNDVANSGSASLTPTFTERNIEGTARIQNNRTMMIASVAQNHQSRGRQGLPVLGLVPVLGRLFTAPRRDDRQTDIVIAVTPHVLRAPTFTPRDDEMRPSGTMQTPTAETLEAMIREVERDEQFAAARRIPTHSTVVLPDAAPSHVEQTPVEQTPVEQTSFIPAPKPLAGVDDASLRTDAASANVASLRDDAPVADAAHASVPTTSPVQQVRPRVINTSHVVAPQQDDATRHVAEEASEEPSVVAPTVSSSSAPAPRSAAQLMLMPEPQALRVGERRHLKLFLKTDAPLGLVAATLRFDPRVVAVRSVTHGNIFTNPFDPPAVTHSVSAEGALLFSVAPPPGAQTFTGAGVLVTIEVEGVAPGASEVGLDASDVHLIAHDGRKVLIKVLTSAVTVR
ncbi:MAG TPA: secretin N-terminal domain-containing protein [Pyrinomonadaceae bacterium]|nr:secretin N-terminal domain-containing protein [Pyrinomonadaceae bacterium]